MTNRIKNVKILPGCVSCGACQAVCPQVFYVDKVSTIKQDVDYQQHEQAINHAASTCPVNVIVVDYEDV